MAKNKIILLPTAGTSAWTVCSVKEPSSALSLEGRSTWFPSCTVSWNSGNVCIPGLITSDASSLCTLSNYKGRLYLKGNITTCRVVEGKAKTRVSGVKYIRKGIPMIKIKLILIYENKCSVLRFICVSGVN